MADGLLKICRKCRSLSQKIKREENYEHYINQKRKYRNKNREKINAEKREYRKNNKEKVKQSYEKWRESENGKIYTKKYYEENKSKRMKIHAQYCSNRRKEDIGFKIVTNMRTNINRAIKTNRKGGTTEELLGCSIAELKEHLQNKFKEGMTWENWTVNGWHVDHIIPCAAFDLTKKEEQKKCFHYTNLQPLWAIENLKKWAHTDRGVR